MSRIFAGTERRVAESLTVKIIGCQYAAGGVERQVVVHAPDAELGTLTARRLADALHAAAAEVEWRDGVDNCQHCDAAGLVERDGTRATCEHPLLVCSPPRGDLLTDDGDDVIE